MPNDGARKKCPPFFERQGASRRFFMFHQPVVSAIPLIYFLNDPKSARSGIPSNRRSLEWPDSAAVAKPR